MALYSMVQFISVLLLYTLLTNLGDAQFLYIDLVITTTVAVLMGWTKAYDKLVPQRPPGSLVSGPNMVSIFSQILVTMAIQVGAYLYLKQQSWYEPLHPATPETEIILCWETTAIFYVSSFQYLILAAVFSKGKPYRQPFYTNIPFFTALVVLAAFTVLITLYPGPTLANFLELMYNYGHPTTHLKFRLLLIGLAGLNLVLCIFIEKAIVERRWLKTVVHILMRKTRPKNKFKIIQREMDEQGWPNVSPMHLS
jgi:cation-transporting ATPase 13A2